MEENLDESVGARKVAVGLDRSQQCLYALQWALENLVDADMGDTILLVHAHTPPLRFLPTLGTPVLHAGVTLAADLLQMLKTHQEDSMQAIFEQAKKLCEEHQVEAKAETVQGDPRDTICDLANEVNADLLVVGSHGESCFSIRRAFLGSVCDYCAHNAHCPVLIVKQPDE